MPKRPTSSDLGLFCFNFKLNITFKLQIFSYEDKSLTN